MLAKKRFVVHAAFVLSLLCRLSASEETQAETSVFVAGPRIRTSGKPFVYASLATNLRARAEVFDSSRKLLVLNITWTPPTEGPKLPESYSLFLDSLAAAETTYCQPNESEYIFVDKNASTSLMPRLLEPTVHGEMRVKAGCTYSIKLLSNPHNGEQATIINYTVPDCVGHVCDCAVFQTLPPPRLLSVNVLPAANTLNVTWTYPTTNHRVVNITNFNIALSSSTTNTSYHNTTVIAKKHVTADAVINGNTTAIYNKVVKLNASLQRGMFYCVELLVEDSFRFCHGRKGNFTFGIPLNTSPEQENTSRSQLVITILPSVTFVLACCLALVMLWQRCGGWICRKYRESNNLQPLHACQGVYKAVSHDGGNCRILQPSFPSTQERNIIYVEKEIEEAKARGDADMFEISSKRLELGKEIGKGAFGRVFFARAESIAGIPGFIPVAVKQLKHKAKADEVEEFLSEIAMLKQVGRHPNVVTMLGCVTIKPPYYMIMEYIPCGDLLQYLRQLRLEYERRTGSSLPFISTRVRPQPVSCAVSVAGPRYIDVSVSGGDSDGSYVQPEMPFSSGRPSIAETEWSLLSSECTAHSSPIEACHRRLEYVLDPKELQNFAVQIARGMAHLESRQITHRDLAARNVLIDENKTLKISDFGLSRSGIYVNTKRKKVPLRWLSVEAMRDNLYSSKSDVWAFAIVLWEIGTLGGFPYPTISDHDLLPFLQEGKRLDKPDNCTAELYSLMLVCWSHSADLRPSFADLVSHLDSVICRRRVYVDFDNLRPDYTFPPTQQQVPVKEVLAAPTEEGPGGGKVKERVGGE